MKYHADGPAVMLGDSSSLFPAQLATYWRSKGLDVVLITHRSHVCPPLSDGTRVVGSGEYETRTMRALTGRMIYPVLSRMEKLVPHFRKRFTRLTALSEDSELWLPYFAEYVAAAWPTLRAAKAQSPRFVFGHEVTTYGLPTALCRGVPRIVFPWGGDVFTYAESSPFHFALTRLCLGAVDLVVPSSTTAARHICERFKLPPEKVIAVSWGVDRTKFKRAEGDKRRELCAKWKIDPNHTVILNPRRFRPDWGAFVSLDSFLQIATEYSNTHFILFGGQDTDKFIKQAKEKIAGKDLTNRFTVLEGTAPLDVCAELMSVSNLFVSLLGRGDMRSASVLQATAAGAAPIVANNPEYFEVGRAGFKALFVEPDNVQQVVEALRVYLRDPMKMRTVVAQNDDYLVKHEDYPTQMDQMLDLIESVCARYAK